MHIIKFILRKKITNLLIPFNLLMLLLFALVIYTANSKSLFSKFEYIFVTKISEVEILINKKPFNKQIENALNDTFNNESNFLKVKIILSLNNKDYSLIRDLSIQSKYELSDIDLQELIKILNFTLHLILKNQFFLYEYVAENNSERNRNIDIKLSDELEEMIKSNSVYEWKLKNKIVVSSLMKVIILMSFVFFMLNILIIIVYNLLSSKSKYFKPFN